MSNINIVNHKVNSEIGTHTQKEKEKNIWSETMKIRLTFFIFIIFN